MPAKKIFFLLGEISAYNSSFQLARKLEEKGYDVLYLVFGEESSHILNNGFHYARIDVREKKGRKIRTMRDYARYYYVHQYVVNRKIEKLILKERPSLCLINSLNFPLSVKFLQHDVPLINYVNGFTHRFDLNVPSVLSGVVPTAGWNGKLRNLFSWVCARITYLRQKGSFALYSKWLLSSGSYRKLDFLSQSKRYGGRVYLSEYNVTLDVPEYFAFPKDMDLPQKKHNDQYVYAGAQLFDRNDGIGTLPFLEKGEKFIYCSLGTWSVRHLKKRDRLKFYQELFSAIRQRPAWRLLVSTPEKDQDPSLLPYPANVTVSRFVSQIEALEAANLFITHGGCASIKEAACCGVPMIVFPGAVDQPGNAARVVYHRLGVRSSFKRVSSLEFLRLMDQVFGDPSFEITAASFKDLCHKQNDCADGIRFLESIMQKDVPAGKKSVSLSVVEE